MIYVSSDYVEKNKIVFHIWLVQLVSEHNTISLQRTDIVRTVKKFDFKIYQCG